MKTLMATAALAVFVVCCTTNVQAQPVRKANPTAAKTVKKSAMPALPRCNRYRMRQGLPCS